MFSPLSEQWPLTVVGVPRLAHRVEVWDGATKLGALPFTKGSTDEQWRSGQTRSLSISFPPTDALKGIIYPGVEIRPYSGFNHGAGPPELIPMGRYPVVESDISIRNDSDITLNCTDRWQLVVRCPFAWPKASNPRLTIVQQVIQLLVETQQWTASDITVQVSSTMKVAAKIWDIGETSRADAIVDLLESIGAEIKIDRVGNPLIRYRPGPSASVATYRGGNGQRLHDLHEILSVADVYNGVRVYSSSLDPAFTPPEYRERITDRAHPAYPRPGVPERYFTYTSADLKTVPQMKAAGQKLLSKVSRRARQLSVTAVGPDYAIDAADFITVVWPSGASEVVQIQSLTHPMNQDDRPQLQTVSNRSDEDFTP